MSWTVSIGTYAKPSDWARSATRAAIGAAAPASASSERKALRTAASIFRVLQATTSPERRIRRTVPAGAAPPGSTRRTTSALATA